MTHSSVHIVYLCKSCESWHERFVGFLDAECAIAEAVRTIGGGFVVAGAATDYGLLALVADDPDGNAGTAYTVFDAGQATRGTRLAGISARVLQAGIEAPGGLDHIVARIAEDGEGTTYLDRDWTRILKHLVTSLGDYHTDEATPMTRETFDRLLGGTP